MVSCREHDESLGSMPPQLLGSDEIVQGTA